MAVTNWKPDRKKPLLCLFDATFVSGPRILCGPTGQWPVCIAIYLPIVAVSLTSKTTTFKKLNLNLFQQFNLYVKQLLNLTLEANT